MFLNVSFCLFPRYNVKEKSLSHEKDSTTSSKDSELKNMKQLEDGNSYCYFLGSSKPDVVENGNNGNNDEKPLAP